MDNKLVQQIPLQQSLSPPSQMYIQREGPRAGAVRPMAETESERDEFGKDRRSTTLIVGIYILSEIYLLIDKISEM